MLRFPASIVKHIEMELDRFKATALPMREKLINVSLKFLPERADAEDVVQDTFLKLWRIRDQLDDYQSVEALAVMITKNLALDVIKKQKAINERMYEQTLNAQIKQPDELLEQKDLVERVRRLIGQLPPLQQSIIQMKDVEGYELAEIAEIIDAKVETVRVNLSRARKKIREQIIAFNR